MIEIQNINALRKGSLLATCDVYIKPWHITLVEIKIFEKGSNRWIGLPSREFLSESGEKKYIELITFDSESVKTRFRNQVMHAIDDYLADNPDMQPEAVIKNNTEIPF